MLHEEIIDGLGSVVKLGSCFRSHNNKAGSAVENQLSSKNWTHVQFFLSSLINQKQVGLSNMNRTKCGPRFVEGTTISML